MKLTLRAKGIVAFMALATYVGLLAFMLSQERATFLRFAVELDQIYSQETALAKAGHAVSHSMLKWQEKFLFSSSDLDPVFWEQVELDVELAQAGLLVLVGFYPEFAKDIDRMNQDVARWRVTPSRSSMIWLREHARELNEHLDQRMRQLRARKNLLWDSYRSEYAAMSANVVIMGAIGATVFGAVMTLFLTRLARDVQQLASRALDIVSGYRGPPVTVTRHDELGDLMEAVNRMQSKLRDREQQLDIAQEQRFHKEKMAAIGSLAAGVAHEINNPIAAIAGIAQSMKDAGRYAPDGETGIAAPDLILEQTKRIAIISRHIAEVTAPHSPDRELLDLNALVRNTCSFISYDNRFRGIDLVLELDSQIRAVNAIADHLTQVLMNLLINAADALENISGRTPTICVTTQASQSEVVMTVHDNGRGMDSDVLARAFEKSYTTKPPDKGRGLGLFLCKSLIEGGGNRIELESTPGMGTTARIHLPLPARHAGA